MLYLAWFVTVFLSSGPAVSGCLGKSPGEGRFFNRSHRSASSSICIVSTSRSKSAMGSGFDSCCGNKTGGAHMVNRYSRILVA